MDKNKKTNEAISVLEKIVTKWQMSEDPYASIMEVDLEERDIQAMETAILIMKESQLRFFVEDIRFLKDEFEIDVYNNEESGRLLSSSTYGLSNLLQYDEFSKDNPWIDVNMITTDELVFYPHYNNKTGEFGVLASYYCSPVDVDELEWRYYEEELKLNKYETEYLKKEFCKEYHDERYHEMLDEHKAEMDFDETERE